MIAFLEEMNADKENTRAVHVGMMKKTRVGERCK